MPMSQTYTAYANVSSHGRRHSALGHRLTTVETYETSLAVHLFSPRAGV
jgi:hypothetical protein